MTIASPSLLVAVASTGLAGTAIFTLTAFRGWTEWLALKRLQASSGGGPGSGGRIELAELRSRVRRLEAIANGIEV